MGYLKLKIVECINNSDVEEALTVGKTYQVLDKRPNTYLIESDSGVQNIYVKARFKKLSFINRLMINLKSKIH